jgi:hypothetical protein
MLPPPASLPGHTHYCLFALLHSADDVFAATETNPDTLTVVDRKVAQKNLHIVKFPGVPAGSPLSRQWVRIRVFGPKLVAASYSLELDLRRFAGRIDLVCPAPVLSDRRLRKYKPAGAATVRKWAAGQAKNVQRFIADGRFDRERCGQMLRDLELVADRPMIALEGTRRHRIPGLSLVPGATQPVFLRVTPPAGAKPGDRWDFTVAIGGRESMSQPFGGSTYLIEIVQPSRRAR